MDAIIGAVRKHVDVPPVPLHLPDPARRMNAFTECDKEDSQRQAQINRYWSNSTLAVVEGG